MNKFLYEGEREKREIGSYSFEDHKLLAANLILGKLP